MKVCVYGLGHLGSVTAACLASVGYEVIGIDCYPSVFYEEEPGLIGLLKSGRASGSLLFQAEVDYAEQADILWITFDTPVDDKDRAAVDFVLGKIRKIMPYVSESTPVIVSSQLPVGSIRKLEVEFPNHHFVCIPENLRHGTAVINFLHPDRCVVGIRRKEDGEKIIPLLHFAAIEWMSVESAEMTKHAINAFLATSICFINEIAAICEVVSTAGRGRARAKDGGSYRAESVPETRRPVHGEDSRAGRGVSTQGIEHGIALATAYPFKQRRAQGTGGTKGCLTGCAIPSLSDCLI